MKLTEEQRLIKLSECETSKDYHSLYEFIFNEEVPETFKRNPNEILQDIIDAISVNEKIEGVVLPKEANI